MWVWYYLNRCFFLVVRGWMILWEHSDQKYEMKHGFSFCTVHKLQIGFFWGGGRCMEGSRFSLLCQFWEVECFQKAFVWHTTMTSNFSSGSGFFSFCFLCILLLLYSYLDRSLSLVEAEEVVRRLPTNGLLSGSCHVTNCRQLEGQPVGTWQALTNYKERIQSRDTAHAQENGPNWFWLKLQKETHWRWIRLVSMLKSYPYRAFWYEW